MRRPPSGAIIVCEEASARRLRMPDLHSPFRDDAHSRGGRSSYPAKELIARAQHLIDAPRPYDGYPLPWHFEALHVGDLTTIAATALREQSTSDVPPARA